MLTTITTTPRTDTGTRPATPPPAAVRARSGGFSADALERLEDLLEVGLETFDGQTASTRRSRSWVVEVDGRVFVRSSGGARRPWYRDVRSVPRLAVWIGAERIASTAIPVTDEALLREVTEALLEKYGYHDDVVRALHQDSVAATLELQPVADQGT